MLALANSMELYKPITAKHGYFISVNLTTGAIFPYSAIVDAPAKLVQQLLEPDEQMEVWRRVSSPLWAATDKSSLMSPEVELIIGKQPPVPEVGATEAQNRFNLTFQRFVPGILCKRASPDLLDDLQWIDAATLKLIELILLDEQTHLYF